MSGPDPHPAGHAPSCDEGLPRRLFEEGRSSQQKDFSTLYALLDDDYIRRRLEQCDSLERVFGDLRLAVRAAMETWDLPALAKWSLAYPRLKLREMLKLQPLLARESFGEAAFRAGFLRVENKRAKALVFIAHHANGKGRRDEAREILDLAAQLKGATIVREERTIFLPMMEGFLAAGFTQAEDLLFSMLEPVLAVHSAVKLSGGGALPPATRASLLSRATEHLREVRPESLRAYAAADLVKELEAAGEEEKASEARLAAPSLPGEEERFAQQPELAAIAAGVARATGSSHPWELLDELCESCAAIVEARTKVSALCLLLRGLAGSSEAPRAEEIFGKLAALAESSARIEEDFRDLLDTASMLLGEGLVEWARALIHAARRAAEGLANRSLKSKALSLAGAGLFAAGDGEAGRDAFRRALEEAEGMLELQERSLLYFWIAGDLAQAGEHSLSDSVFISALMLEEEALRPCEAVFSLSAIACCLASLDDMQGIRESMTRNLARAEETPESHVRAGVLVALATCLWSFEELDWSREVFRKAREAAASTIDRNLKARSLAAVGENLAGCGDAEGALECFDLASAAASEIVKEGPRVETLCFVAGKLVAIGERDRAREIVARARESIGGIELWTRGRVEALASIAAVLIAVGEKPEALGVLERALEISTRIEKLWDASWARNAVAKGFLAAQSLDDALETASSIRDLAPAADAKISCARFAALFQPECTLAILKEIHPVSEMNRGIGEVTLDLTRDSTPPTGAHLELLRELTILALEDWFTCDFVLSRWAAISKDREALYRMCLDLGRLDPDNPHPPTRQPVA